MGSILEADLQYSIPVKNLSQGFAKSRGISPSARESLLENCYQVFGTSRYPVLFQLLVPSLFILYSNLSMACGQLPKSLMTSIDLLQVVPTTCSSIICEQVVIDNIVATFAWKNLLQCLL